MIRGGAAALAVLVCTFTPPAHGGERGVLLGDEYRWANAFVLKRVAVDLAAIPLNAPQWDDAEWAEFIGFGAAVGMLWFGDVPSPDVRLDRWLTQNADGRVPVVWSVPFEVTLWSSIAVGGLGTWGWSEWTDRHDLAQGLSLMGESLAVWQAYHVLTKLALGRDGPTDSDGTGVVRGPLNALRVWPAGTPSGHAGTLYSLMAAGFAYFDPPWWVQVPLHAFVGTVVAFHVINHRHFISDSLWGAAAGWHVGRWVVTHRASWLYTDRAAKIRVALIPVRFEDGGGGLALAGAF